jgi:hypothetical protein
MDLYKLNRAETIKFAICWIRLTTASPDILRTELLDFAENKQAVKW